VTNVLDTNYWETGGAEILLNLGAPRTFRVSLTADF
jgi:outer membrane receptor protein involved in Fe transport